MVVSCQVSELCLYLVLKDIIFDIIINQEFLKSYSKGVVLYLYLYIEIEDDFIDILILQRLTFSERSGQSLKRYSHLSERCSQTLRRLTVSFQRLTIYILISDS